MAYYVQADASGRFSITGDYLCSGTGPVYILATQGNPGLGSGKSNPALAELAVLGPCANGATLSPALNSGVTEVSTVTGVYALAGYMTASNAISSNGAASTLSQTGITNAAGNAAQFASLTTGQVLTTTPNGVGTVPAAAIGDILIDATNRIHLKRRPDQPPHRRQNHALGQRASRRFR